MYPHERSLVRRLADKPFTIIGVNSDKELDFVRGAVKEKSITWRSFWNGEEGTGGPISKDWKVSSWPTTYLIDKEGVIRYKNVRGKSLDKAIEALMAEMGEEVELVGVDHEAEDAAALAAAKESTENNADDEKNGEEKTTTEPEEKEAGKEQADG